MADVILSAMNKTANPCEDFYEYACGTWIHSNDTLPPDQAHWSRMAMFNRKLSKDLRMILESNNVYEPPVELAKQWYASCMDEEALEGRGIEPLSSIVTAVGGWPIAMELGQWNLDDYSWQEIELYYSRLTGFYALYNLEVATSWHNASVNELSLKIPDLPLVKMFEYRKSFDPEDKEAYFKLITAVGRAFATSRNARVSDEKIAKEANDIIKFEMELDKIRKDGSIIADRISLVNEVLDQKMTDADKAKINIWKLAQNLIQGFGQIEITEEEPIAVEGFYLLQLSALLNETSIRTIVNYIHWYYISHLLFTTNFEMRNLLSEYAKETLGIRETIARWEQCVNQMELNHALAYQFVLEHFTEETHKSGLEMIQKIQTELDKRMNMATWMNEETREVLKDKLWSVNTFIGYPDWYRNVTNLEEYYEGLTISNDFFNNVLNHMRFAKKKTLQTLRDIDSKPEWLSDPITVNAFYIVQTNSMNIPAADFQPPLFTPMMPNAVKYGIIGSALGHELSHGFDDDGTQFDKNFQPINWTETMLSGFGERSKCFVDQFSDLVKGSNSNEPAPGSQTVGENIADTMGLQAAFSAYETIVKADIKGDRKLPGLEELSNEQLLMLSYATSWCDVATLQHRRKVRLSKDPHSTPRVRTIGTVSNIEGFGDAFNCPKGSPMNPPKKCHMWSSEPGA